MARSCFAWLALTVVACSEIAGLGDERTHFAGAGGTAPDASAGSAGSGGSSASSGGIGGSSGSTGGAAGSSGSTAGVAGASGSTGGVSGASGSAGGSSGAAGSAGSGGGSGAAGASGGDAGVDAPADACGANLDDDPLNCGQCAHDCLGGDCVTGKCQAVKLVDTAHGAYDVACTGDTVFWTNQHFGGVYAMSTVALSPTSWSPFGGPTHITSAGTTVFFASPGHDTVYGVPSAATQAPAQYWAAPQTLTVVAADASGAYFDGPSTIYVSDGSKQTLVASSVEQAHLLALDSGFVYFSSIDSGSVFRVPKSGPTTAPAPLHITSANATRAIAVDAQHVYFATWPASADILRKNKDGSGTTQTVASGQYGVFDMVRAGAYLYWVNTGSSGSNFKDGSVRRARIDGATPGATENVANNLEFSRGICADAQAVYWITRGLNTPEPQSDGTIWRHAL